VHRLENLVDRQLAAQDDLARPIFVLDVITQARFEDVGKWSMADVVNQCAGKKSRPRLPDVLILTNFLQAIQRLLHEVKDAQAMTQSSVLSAWKGVMTDAELMNPPKPLHLGTIQQAQQPFVFLFVDADIVVKWVAEDFVGHGISPDTWSCDNLPREFFGAANCY
jgi:hypothetical protein